MTKGKKGKKLGRIRYPFLLLFLLILDFRFSEDFQIHGTIPIIGWLRLFALFRHSTL